MKAHAMSNHLVLAALAVVVLAAQPARASLWTGAANDNNWDNLSNWDSNPSGGVGEVDTLTAYPILTGANTIVPNDLKIAAANPSSTGRVDIRSGTFTINYWGFVGDWGGNATLNLADTTTSGGIYTGFGTGSGSFTNTANGNGNFMVGLYNSTGVVNMNTSGSLDVTELRLSPNGQSGSATFNLDNGSVNVAGSFTVGSDFWGANTNSPAYLNMSGGTITTGYEFWIGGSGQGTGTMTGGTINSGTYFVVGRNSGSVGVFNLSGGTVDGATTDGFTVMGSFAGSSGTLNVSGSAVLNSPREMRIGEGGTGTLNQTGGTVSVGGVTHVGYGGNNASTQIGTLRVSGGTFTSEGDLELGYAGGSSAQANVTVDGGTLNVGTTTKRWLIVSRYDTVSSTLTVSSGNLNLNAGTDLRFSIGGNSGTNTVTLNGGAITSYSGNQTGDGAGVVDLAQGSGVANNTFNLDGGTLAIRAVITNNDTATATFNFNGGTLKATGDDANFVNLGGANQRANVLEGGAVMDSNGYNVTVVQPLLHGGTAATDGGLVKSGTGTLTLSNTNTYTGPTMVAAGVLAVNGSVTSDVTVATDATLQGIGAVGSVTGTSTVYGRVAPGNSIGTLTVNGSMAISGTFDVEYDDTLTQPIDLLNVSGTLDITSAAVDFADISSGSIGLSGMAYVFATYGTLSGSQFASVVDLPSGYTIDYAYGGNNIALVPEPTAALLAGLGLLGLLRRRRR